MLISVATLIATLPTAARAQAEPPGALDLATLPGTLNNNWYINLAYLNGTWVYKVGASDTQAPTTGTMPEVGRQFVIHPSADPDSGNPPALTLKDAVITSSFNQLFYIKAGAEPTLRIEGENRIEIMSDLIYNLGTLTLTVADAQEISQGILNGSPAGTGTLTVYAQAPLSIGAISNFQNARMHLDGEIHVISKTGGSALKNDNTSPDAITFGDNARIHLQANALCTYVSGFIELDFDTAPTDGRTLSVTPAGDDEPEQTYLSTFPAAHPDRLTSYTGLREITPAWIVIDKETAFDASMPGQWLRVTEKGVLTVGKIGENGVFPLVNDLELQDGGQIRFADDGVLGLVAARFTHLFPNRNQWRATTLAADNADKLAGDAGTPCYVRTGYPDATDQTWQPADPDNLYMQFAAGDPVLIAGEGPETDTLRLNYGNTYLFKDSPDSPVEPTSPAEPLNMGVFLFKGNRASYNVEMRNIYVLSDDGSRFELKDRVTLRPFESYVVANAATQALLKSLRLDGIVTGTELAEIPADNSFRAWTADGRLHLSADHAEKVAVYHVSGTLKCYLPLLRGETTIALPSGIYLVRQGGTAIKVVL